MLALSWLCCSSQISLLSAGPIVALELVAPNGIEALKRLAGPEDPEVAKVKAPSSIRALYGYNSEKNSIYVASDPKAVSKVSTFPSGFVVWERILTIMHCFFHVIFKFFKDYY